MKKIICFVLITIMLVNPVSVRASSAAASLEISGGLASGGLSGGAGSITIAVALTLMVMRALGMQVKLTEQAKAAGETAQTYIENMYAQWVGGTSAKELTESQREELKKRFKVISTGGSDNQGNSNNKVNKNGKIYLAAGALALIQKFLNWLNSKGKISNNVIIPGEFVGDTLYSNGAYPVYKRINQQGQYEDMYSVFPALRQTDEKLHNVKTGVIALLLTDVHRTNNICFAFFAPRNAFSDISQVYSPLWYCKMSNAFPVLGQEVAQGVGGDYRYNNWLYCYAGAEDGRFGFCNVPPGIKVLETTSKEAQNTIKSYLDTVNWEVGSSENDSYIEGDYNSSQLDNPNSGYTVLDPALFNQLLNNIDAGTQAQLSIEEYIKAIMNQLNKQSNPEAVPQAETVPVVNPTDLSPIPQPLPDPDPDPVPGTFPSDEPAPGDNDPPLDSDPVNNPEPAPPDVAVPKMMIPLDEYFPFCIPFDVYHLLQKLSADPVAPSYTIGFTVYGTEVNYTISLDAFSSAMVIVRRMELFVCVVGLAIASRKIFTR